MPSIAYDMIPSGGGYHCSSSANSTKSVSPLSPPSTSSPTFSTSSLRIGQSKKGKSHISRPPNAFLLFRSEFWAREKQKKNPVERDHRDISRIAAHCWRSLDDTAKQVYYQRASKLREQHQIQYPTYKFTPAPRKTRKKSKKTDENDARCALLASQLMPEYVPSYSPPLPIVNATDWNRLPILQPTPRLPEQPNPIIGFESAFGDNNSSTIPFSAYPSPAYVPPDTDSVGPFNGVDTCTPEDLNALWLQIYNCDPCDLQGWQVILQTGTEVQC